MDDSVIRYYRYKGETRGCRSRQLTHTTFSSNISMSPISRPADFTAAGMATAGPTPITAGPTPTATKLLIDGVKQQLNATMN